MVDEALLKELKAKRDGTSEREPGDVFKVFEAVKQVAAEDEEIQEEMEDVDICVQFDSKDSDMKFWVEVRNDAINYGEGDGPDVTTTFLATDETIRGLLSGEVDGTSAYMSGDLTIEGNLQDAIAFGEVLGMMREELEDL